MKKAIERRIYELEHISTESITNCVSEYINLDYMFAESLQEAESIFKSMDDDREVVIGDTIRIVIDTDEDRFIIELTEHYTDSGSVDYVYVLSIT